MLGVHALLLLRQLKDVEYQYKQACGDPEFELKDVSLKVPRSANGLVFVTESRV